jgi:hypothetical protein
MSRLMRLPAEVRNAIYAYALAFQYGLRYYHDQQCSAGRMQIADANSITNPPIDWSLEDYELMILHDANQLKFVNKQLHSETRGLVLRYNDIRFHTIQDTSLFLSTCPTSYHKCLRTFSIQRSSFGRTYPYPIQDMHSLEQVFDFCRQAPHVQVQNLQGLGHSLEGHSPNFPIDAACLQWITRHQMTWYTVFVPQTCPWRYHHHSRRSANKPTVCVDETPAGAMPSNFRLILSVSTLSSASQAELLIEFRRFALGSRFYTNYFLPYVVGGIDRWVGLAKEMLKDGV